MPTNRTPRRRRAKGGQLTPEAIAAWHACDYNALHCALGLRPHEMSPLPSDVICLGVSEDDPPDPNSTSPYEQSYWKAIELHRKLLAAAGWPADARQAYEANLKEAKSWARYCLKLVRHPEYAGQGTGDDPASLRRRLEKANDEVDRCRHLLATFDDVQKAHAPQTMLVR